MGGIGDDMRTELFTGKVQTNLLADKDRGLAAAVGLLVPANKKRRVMGYRLHQVAEIAGDALNKVVTIRVTYR